MSWEQYQTAYNQASQGLKYIIDSNQIPIYINLLATTDSVLERQSFVVINLWLDYILGLLPETEFDTRLNSLGLSNESLQLIQKRKLEMASQVKSNANISWDSEPVVTETEEQLQKIDNLRTMSTDQHATESGHEYTNTQSAILREEK